MNRKRTCSNNESDVVKRQKPGDQQLDGSAASEKEVENIPEREEKKARELDTPKPKVPEPMVPEASQLTPYKHVGFVKPFWEIKPFVDKNGTVSEEPKVMDIPEKQDRVITSFPYYCKRYNRLTFYAGYGRADVVTPEQIENGYIEERNKQKELKLEWLLKAAEPLPFSKVADIDSIHPDTSSFLGRFSAFENATQDRVRKLLRLEEERCKAEYDHLKNVTFDINNIHLNMEYNGEYYNSGWIEDYEPPRHPVAFEAEYAKGEESDGDNERTNKNAYFRSEISEKLVQLLCSESQVPDENPKCAYDQMNDGNKKKCAHFGTRPLHPMKILMKFVDKNKYDALTNGFKSLCQISIPLGVDEICVGGKTYNKKAIRIAARYVFQTLYPEEMTDPKDRRTFKFLVYFLSVWGNDFDVTRDDIKQAKELIKYYYRLQASESEWVIFESQLTDLNEQDAILAKFPDGMLNLKQTMKKALAFKVQMNTILVFSQRTERRHLREFVNKVQPSVVYAFRGFLAVDTTFKTLTCGKQHLGVLRIFARQHYK